MQDVLRACDEHAGSRSRSRHSRRRFWPPRSCNARDELSPVDPQLTVEEMQLLWGCMRMCGVARAGRAAYEHADAVPFRVGREQLALDPGRDLRHCSDVVGRSTSVGQATN
jgi:hypothetical protein